MQPVTSVPAWSSEPAQIDPAARDLCLVGLEQAGISLAVGWQAAASVPCAVLTAAELDDALLARFRAVLASAVVGWRLMLAGPQPAVAQLSAAAVSAGAEESEIRVSVTSASQRRVYCVHCARLADFEVELGQLVRCPGCERDVRVRPHYSPRLFGYLGVCDAT